RGYKRVDLPWHANLAAIKSTLDDVGRAFELSEVGLLIGSAEQAFVQAMMNGTLGVGRFVALTPCFRNEPVFDEVHQPYFMKVELFDTNVNRGRSLEIAHEAQMFMSEVSGIIPEIIKTDA